MPDETLVPSPQLTGKTLYAVKNVDIYNNTSNYAQTIGTVKPGYPVGVVDSYNIKGDKFWWVFYPSSAYGKPFYAIHDPKKFSLVALKQQGVKTSEEIVKEKKEKEKEDKPFYDKILDGLGKGAKTAGIALLGFLVLKEVLKKKSK